MKPLVRIGLALVVLVALASQPAQAEPPFFGTIFIDPDIITSSDLTTFQEVSDAGRGFRLMFDRRVNDWIYVNAYLFNASFDDALTSEIQVNPEFGSSSAALSEAQKYGIVIGRLPTGLRADVETVWIHQGTEPFGGGNNNLLIHTGQADLYAADGILEETLMHEASHTSLDAAHASAPGWLAAQIADSEFISTYARDFPDREDVAESFLPYVAVLYRSDRISQSLADTILQTIPNRIDYFDDQSFNMYPLVPKTTEISELLIDSPPVTVEIAGHVLLTAEARVDVTPGYSQASATLETILAVTHTGARTGVFANEGEHLGEGIFVDAIRYNPGGITIDILQAAPGDVNGDRQVDTADILAILSANSFGNSGAGPGPGGEWFWEHGDNNGDGVVDNTDIQNILAANLFGRPAYAALTANVTVPEPSVFVLALMAAVGLLLRRGRRRSMNRAP